MSCVKKKFIPLKLSRLFILLRSACLAKNKGEALNCFVIYCNFVYHYCTVWVFSLRVIIDETFLTVIGLLSLSYENKKKRLIARQICMRWIFYRLMDEFLMFYRYRYLRGIGGQDDFSLRFLFQYHFPTLMISDPKFCINWHVDFT